MVTFLGLHLEFRWGCAHMSQVGLCSELPWQSGATSPPALHKSGLGTWLRDNSVITVKNGRLGEDWVELNPVYDMLFTGRRDYELGR